MRQVNAWIHPDFKRKLKRDAADKGISIIEHTRQLAREDETMMKPIKTSKGRYEFGL